MRVGEVSVRVGEVSLRVGEVSVRVGEVSVRVGEVSVRVGEVSVRVGATCRSCSREAARGEEWGGLLVQEWGVGGSGKEDGIANNTPWPEGECA